MVISIEVMEGGMWQPGFIEMQRVNLAIQHFFNLFHVVQHTVISGLRNGQYARLNGFVGRKRVALDFFLDVFPSEFGFWNWADNTEMVTRRHEENGNRAGHDDRMQN